MIGGKLAVKKKRRKTVAAEHDPVGLDIGTANIVVCRNGRTKVSARKTSNVFFTVPCREDTKTFLTGGNIKFFEKNDSLYILGGPAEEFALIMGGAARHPMEGGMLNLGEEEGVNVIHAILSRLIPPAKNKNEPLWFSIPGKPIDSTATAMFNESIFKTFLENLGYSPRPINEGMAVVISELSTGPATGIGISIGGGMCNVCCSYLSIPVVTYSIQMGGDDIDKMVAGSVGESPVKIKAIKESELDLSALPKNSIEHGLHACFDNLFSILTKSLGQVLNDSDNVPKLREAVPIVLSGGTILTPGSRDKFASMLQKVKLPFKVSDIILSKYPLYSTARGAYLMAADRENA
jgi:hypothetical protein